MVLAAPGSAAINIFPSGRSCNSVCLWQWSGLFCDTRTTSGSSISDRCWIALGTTRSVTANHDALTIELPTSHGSIRTLKAPLADWRSVADGFFLGEKIKRNELSALRCRTVTDMAEVVQESPKHVRRWVHAMSQYSSTRSLTQSKATQS